MSAWHAGRDLWRGAAHERLPWLTLAAAAGCAAAARLAGAVALGDGEPVTDAVLAWSWWVVVCGTALRLGVRVPELGWSSLALSGPVSPLAWCGGRLAAVAVVHGAQVLTLVVAGALAGAGVSGGGVASLWLEAVVWAAVVALLACWVRPWLAATLGAGLGIAGQLQEEYASALGGWGLGGIADALYLVVPGLDLVRDGSPLGAVHGLGWVVALGCAAALSLRVRDLPG